MTDLRLVPIEGAEVLHCPTCESTLMANPDVDGVQRIEHNDDGSHTWWADQGDGMAMMTPRYDREVQR